MIKRAAGLRMRFGAAAMRDARASYLRVVAGLWGVGGAWVVVKRPALNAHLSSNPTSPAILV